MNTTTEQTVLSKTLVAQLELSNLRYTEWQERALTLCKRAFEETRKSENGDGNNVFEIVENALTPILEPTLGKKIVRDLIGQAFNEFLEG